MRGGLILGFLLAWIPGLAAASSITVSPAFQDVAITQAMSGKDIAVTLTNQSTVGQTYALSTADFGTLDESGGVALIGTPATELEHRYGLVSWMTLDRSSVYLTPGGSETISIRIDNRASLAPGGHYAALLATAVADPDPSKGDPKVNVKQVIASLILLRKEGGAEPGLNLVGLKAVPAVPWKLPAKVELRFRDSGNVHVVPHGTLEVKSPTGEVVAKGIINEDSVFVYPQSFRKMTSSLQRLKTAWLPGRYTLTAQYRLDDERTLSSVTKSFWYLGAALTWLILIVFLVFSMTLIWFMKKRWRKR